MHEIQYRSSNAYNYGNVAVRRVREERNIPTEVHQKPQKIQKKAQTAKVVKSKSTWKAKLKLITTIGFIFACSLLIVYRYVMIWETGARAESLKNNYAAVVAENDNIQAQLNTCIDLKELEKIAHERLGMIRPERYQMFYVDMQNNDRSEAVEEVKADAAQNTAPVSGVPGMLISALELLK